MLKKLIFVGVLCTTLIAMLGTNAMAGFTYWGWPGFGYGSPYHITHNIRGGTNLSTLEPGDATIYTTLRVLIGDLVLYNPNDHIVLGGVGFSVPVEILSDLGGVDPDENGNYFIDQFLPFDPGDCPVVPGCANIDSDPSYPYSETDNDHKFFHFWFPDLLYYDIVKINSRIKEVRIKLAQIEVTFTGDRARDAEVDARYFTCEDLRADAWPPALTYIRGDVQLAEDGTVIQSAPFACDDTYTTSVNNTIRISASHGLLSNDYDHDGDVLAVYSVDDSGLQGTLNFDENGRFVYTPPRDWVGVESLSYIAVDSQGNLSNEAFWDIIVEPEVTNSRNSGRQ